MTPEHHGRVDPELDRARQLLKDGQLDDALAEIEGFEQRNGADARVLLLKGTLKRKLGQAEEARELLVPLVRQVPQLAAGHQELGLALLALGRHGEAKQSLRAAVELDRRLVESWRRLGEIYALEGDEDRSQQALRGQLVAVSRHPLLAEAVELFEQGRIGLAEGICRDYLERFPTDVNGIRLLADIGIRLGRFGDAAKLLERCLELAPNYVLARHDYANALAKSHDFTQALAQVALLEKAEPDNLAYSVLAASILVQVGDYEGAIRRYRDAIARAPQVARLHTSLGHALKTVSRPAEGVEAYRRAIEIDPALGEAYWSLANLKTFRFSPEEIESMKGQLKRKELDAANAFHLCFALGKALEDSGEIDDSFAYYSTGNEVKMKLSDYDAERNHARVEKTIAACTQQMLADSHGGHPAADPIFIVGLPRSGSTLLEQILASHSRVEGTMELPYISQIARRLAGGAPDSESSRYPGILGELDETAREKLGEEYLGSARVHRHGAAYFVDKMPNNFAHVALIHRILPNAKIIDARRHPMAACFSCFKQLFAAGQTFTYGLENIGRYYRDYLALMDHWNAVLPGKVLLVEYEKVVGGLEAEVKRLLDFCGLPFEPSCLEFYATPRAVRTASSEQVRQPIYAESIEHWRRYERHLEPLRRALGPALERYPVEARKPASG